MIIPPELESKIIPSCLRHIREGRGTGEREHYKPMIQTYEMRGRGQRTMIPSTKFPRKHHMMSGIESDLLMILDFSSIVADIREQYPLDISETYAIANELGFKHPGDKGLLAIGTADFYIPMSDGRVKVRTVKDKEALADKRTAQKLEIEEVYFKRMGITDWAIVTPGEIDPTYLNNVKQLRGYLSLLDYGLSDKEIERARVFLESHLDRHPCLAACANVCDEALCLEVGQSLAVAKHLIATKEWGFDLCIQLNPSEPGQHRGLLYERPIPKPRAA